jgi:CBS domain-containing protein
MKAIYVNSRDADGHARLARRPITQVMSQPAVVVLANDLLDEALIKMINTGLRHLAVVDGSGRCMGVLSDRAIASAWATDYAALSRRTVLSVLDAEPATTSAGAAVLDAAEVMRRTGVDAVAVVDADGWPVGVVTGSDLVALLAK